MTDQARINSLLLELDMSLRKVEGNQRERMLKGDIKKDNCPNCGQENSEIRWTCSNCGQALQYME
jgi:predicted amidophosphoribosyltransferase